MQIENHIVAALPHEGVRALDSGLMLEPLAAVVFSGGVVPCHSAAGMRHAIWFVRSDVWVTETEVSPPEAIR